MLAYRRSSCLDHPSPEEHSAGEVEARIIKVLDSAVILSPGVGPGPLRTGIASVRVSTLGPVSTTFAILSFHYARDLVKGLGDGCIKSWDIDPSVDALGWEARHASNGAARTSEERERDRCAISWAARK
jgi:hypothetical protein